MTTREDILSTLRELVEAAKEPSDAAPFRLASAISRAEKLIKENNPHETKEMDDSVQGRAEGASVDSAQGGEVLEERGAVEGVKELTPRTQQVLADCLKDCKGNWVMSLGYMTKAHEDLEIELSAAVKRASWRPASTAPYDEICLFLTYDGHVVEGFIYDGDEKDFGYTHWMPIPALPTDAAPRPAVIQEGDL